MMRWHGSLEKTRAATAKTHAIEQLCREMPDSPPSLIVTLHQKNAAAEHLPRMTQWFCELDRLGVPSARLHLLEVDHEDVQAHFALALARPFEQTFWHLEDTSLERLRFDITSDMKALLSGGPAGQLRVAELRSLQHAGRSWSGGRRAEQQLRPDKQRWH